MLIAKKNNFSIRHKKFLGNQVLTTYQIELYKDLADGTSIAICRLDKETKNLISIENRLLDSIKTEDDINTVKLLTKILYNIYDTDEIKVD